MKKVLLLLVGLGLVISCDKEEALDDSSNTFDTTSIMALIESGNNNTSRDVNRPGSVLDFINTIEITADHVGTIGAPYLVSEEYTMVDDGTGASGFVLEDVALGRNKFEAYAKSYNQIPAQEYLWIEDQANMPWEWIDAQRGRHPNVNFYDNDNALQDIYEATQNVVDFDMQAESGRLIVGVKLSDEIRDTYNSNNIYIQHQVKYADGTKSDFSPQIDFFNFNQAHQDDLLTFYFSDNDKSITGACVIFRFTVCDVNPIETHEFFREICIENGMSIGCVYEITGDAVVEDITNFEFKFNWEEVDCAPCPSNNYVTTVPSEVTISDVIAELCAEDTQEIVTHQSMKNVSILLDELGSYMDDSTVNESLLTNEEVTIKDIKNADGSNSGLILVVNGLNVGGFGVSEVIDHPVHGSISGGFNFEGGNTAILVKFITGSTITHLGVPNGATFLPAGSSYQVQGIANCN